MSSYPAPQKLPQAKPWQQRVSTIALLLTVLTIASEILLLIIVWNTLGAKGLGHSVVPIMAILTSVAVGFGWLRFVNTSPSQSEPQLPPQLGGGTTQAYVGQPQGLNLPQPVMGYPPGYQGNTYTPIVDQDELKAVALPPPRPYRYKEYKYNETRCFIAPKEGNNPSISDDKYAVERLRYALADGASTSFQPARWAEVLVNSYVKRPYDFVDQQDFNYWLKGCSERWEQRVRKEWLPYVKLSDWEDPDAMIAQGAQSTFIACSLTKEGNGDTFAHIFVIGDANFFLFRPSAHGMKCEAAYPLQNAERSSFTDTLLSTMSDRKLMQAWQTWLDCKRLPPYQVQRGDCIVLATDEMAIWLLKRVNDVEKEQLFKNLLSITDEQEFQRFVAEERRSGRMELDDTTLLIIPFLK